MFTQDTSKDVHGKASYNRTSLVGQMVKHLPTMRETRVQSLGWEDLLEKEMATHSNILAWKIPWAEEPGRLQSTGSESDTTERLHFPFPDMHQQYSRQTSFILWWNITLQ